ncbi:MAG TPA: ABC transporter ATP-binding protein, partial [Aggregatilineales bacterium]|nr:ABC transporter ATP-binding protein [Aggregatilineales bacterium]
MVSTANSIQKRDSQPDLRTDGTDARPAPVVSMRGVYRRFKTPSGPVVQALQDINLDIFPGEFVSIIGPSGCGKSTLIRIAGDLLPVSDGTVKINGHPPHEARLKRDYGMVFQAPTLYDWRTVIKNIEMPLEIMGWSADKRQARAGQMLKLVELDDFANHYPWQLSGGMQQRVAIARALTFEPSILFMDEPFGALDEITRERMNIELLKIWEKTRTTVIFITHSIHEAVYLSSRIVVMSPRPGRIVDDITIELPYPRAPEVRDSEAFFHMVSRV